MSERHWRPSASMGKLRMRADILSRLRSFFYAREVMEVETPLLSWAAATDPHIDSIPAHYQGPGAPHGATLWLHTSPEYAMKRLLAAGSGAIFQVCKVFRQGERGVRHNPEFTMLEWYRPGWDHHALMAEVEALTHTLLAPYLNLGATERISYRELFLRELNLDPFTAELVQLKGCAKAHGIDYLDDEPERDTWLNLLLSHLIEPKLGQGHLLFLHGYPISQAALARVQSGEPPTAARFELYLNGVELANGFHELTDSAEQRGRFLADQQLRQQLGKPPIPLDQALLEAMSSGMPECAGVAMGLDRLVMQAASASLIDDVISFPLERA